MNDNIDNVSVALVPLEHAAGLNLPTYATALPAQDLLSVLH